MDCMKNFVSVQTNLVTYTLMFNKIQRKLFSLLFVVDWTKGLMVVLGWSRFDAWFAVRFLRDNLGVI